jgi:sugar/nucleoside kinase (ribokinase family)
VRIPELSKDKRIKERPMIKIACVGDNVVDINYIDGMIHPGGNCVNVAVYCSQMGHKAAYVGVLADDANAKIVTDSLTAYGVEWRMCPVLHGETGRCPVQLVDGDRILSDENDGGLVKSDPLVLTEEILSYLKDFDVVHTSCYSYFDEQLYKIRDLGIPLLYDFSTVWNRDEARLKMVTDVSDFVLFSEIDELSDEENDRMLKDAVDVYGCKLAIMTKGIKGAFVYDGKKLYSKAPYNAEAGAIDTTGCGDSWISGFITTYVEIMGRMKAMKASSDDAFITGADEEDVHAYAIEAAMCMGNLKARYTCRIKGAYDWGEPIRK